MEHPQRDQELWVFTFREGFWGAERGVGRAEEGEKPLCAPQPRGGVQEYPLCHAEGAARRDRGRDGL